MSSKIRVLFVCLGNICRSPVAEGVCLHRLKALGLDHRVEVDSAGLGSWHSGELPDARARAVASRHGVHLPSRARVIDPGEFDRTHWIVCMDHQNRRALERLGAPSDRVRLLKSFAPCGIGSSDEVDDPYQEGAEAFDRMFVEIAEAVEHLIQRLIEIHGLSEGRSASAGTAANAGGADGCGQGPGAKSDTVAADGTGHGARADSGAADGTDLGARADTGAAAVAATGRLDRVGRPRSQDLRDGA